MKICKNLKPLSEDQMSMVVGSLLGDACLHCSQYYYNWNLVKSQSKYDKNNVDKKQYMEWHFSFLGEYSARLVEKTREHNNVKKDDYVYYAYSTFSQPVFTDLAKKWYKNDGQGNWEKKNNKIIKVVPKDIKLTPLTLCIWLMDDGFCYAKDANAILCTHGFQVEEVDFLINRLKEDLNITSKLRLVKQKWKGVESEKPVIYIGRKSYFDMINIIKLYVNWDCFKYKIDTTTYNKQPHRGETHSLSKLKDEEVKYIFELRKQGMLHREIANKIGICQTSVTLILNGKQWGHLGLGDKTPSKRKKSHFSDEIINKALQLKNDGLSQEAIAKELDMNQSTVSRILNREYQCHK